MMEEEPQEETLQEEQIQKPQEEEDFESKYLRLLADMENSRKRLQKEKQDMTRFAVQNVLCEILAPLDTFESALGFAGQMSEETKNWAQGFQMILGQFKELLEHHGVHPFTSEGEIFDPHKHEAVEVEETEDHKEGTILKEFLKGYKCGERILRAARVKVAKKPAPEKESEENKEGENNE